MRSLISKKIVFAFLVLGLFVSKQGLAQTVSGMKTGLAQLKFVLDKEKAVIDSEIIWSNPSYSISPVTKDPKGGFRTKEGAIVGVIHLQRKIEAFKQVHEGTYALKMKGVEGTWRVEFLDIEGRIVSTVTPETIEFVGRPLASPRVYAVPGFISKDGRSVLLWCWDNFCVSLPLQ